MEPYKIIESKKVFEGIIMDIYHDRISLPDGASALREIVQRGNASAVIPIDGDGNMVLVRQYRHSLKSLSLEIPAGMINDGEDPLDCAVRELEEETGYRAAECNFLLKFYSAIGFCTEVLHIYEASGLTETCQHLDDDEFVTVEKYSPDKALEMIYSGEITDSKTIIAIQAYLLHRLN